MNKENTRPSTLITAASNLQILLMQQVSNRIKESSAKQTNKQQLLQRNANDSL